MTMSRKEIEMQDMEIARMRLGDVGLLLGARTLWQEDLLCDYTIEVEEEKFKVHKVVMASVSDYFKVMLTGGMVESQTDRVRLEGQNSLVVSTMIKYMYTGEFDKDEAQMEELLACAVYLQIPAAIKKCTELLNKKVDKENCLDLLNTFQMFHLDAGIKHTVSYIKLHFDAIVEQHAPHSLDHAALCNLMNLWQHSEWQLFVCVDDWVQLDPESRTQHLEKLIGLVRFALIPPQELRSVKKRPVYSTFALVRDRVNEALRYHSLAVNLKVLDESEQSSVRAQPSPMCYIAERSNSQKMYSYYNERSWKQHKGHRRPTFNSELDAAVVVNNYLVLCEPTTQTWHVFDPRTFKWATIAPTVTPKAKFALVLCDSLLYVLGGLLGPCVNQEDGSDPRLKTDEIERYDFRTNTWSVLADKLPVALYEHSAGSINGCIYVGGGKGTSEGRFSTRLDCYDPCTGKWSRKAAMTPPVGEHRKLQVVELPGEKVLFFVGLHLNVECYRPSTDQWEWVNYGKTPKADWYDCSVAECKDVTILSHKNTLFLLDATFTKEQSHSYNAGLCESWTLGKKGERIGRVGLKRFPKYKDNETGGHKSVTGNHFGQMKTAFAVILSIPQYM